MFSLLKYLENEGSQNGYILYDKGKIYSNTIFFDEAPRKGDRTYIDIKFFLLPKIMYIFNYNIFLSLNN